MFSENILSLTPDTAPPAAETADPPAIETTADPSANLSATETADLSANKTADLSATETADPSANKTADPNSSETSAPRDDDGADDTKRSDIGTDSVPAQTPPATAAESSFAVPEITPTPAPTTEPTPEPTTEPTPTAAPETEEDIRLTALDLDGTDISAQLSGGETVTISDNGAYYAADVTASGEQNILVTADADAELTLSSVNLETTLASPVKLEDGARLTLHLEGENVLKAMTTGYAGIAVNASDRDSRYAELIIDGTGSLDVTGAINGAGIGTSRYAVAFGSTGRHGKITINGGNVTATGGNAAAGIGTGANVTAAMYSADITINGGTVRANGGITAAGIGSSSSAPMSRIIINGGNVYASPGSNGTYGIGTRNDAQKADTLTVNGGSIVAVCRSPVNKYGEPLHQIILQMPISAAEAEVTVGTWSAFTDDQARLYPFVTDDTHEFALDHLGTVYYTTEITKDETLYTLSAYDGPPCSCTEENAAYTVSMPETITVNVTDGVKTEKLNTSFVHGSCTYPIHPLEEKFTVTADGEEDTSLAEAEGGFLKVYYAAAGRTVTVTAEATLNGVTHFSDSEEIQIQSDEIPRFDISAGNISISSISGDPANMRVKAMGSEYTVPRSQTVRITQSSEKASGYYIEIDNVSPRVQLDGVNIYTASNNCLNIRGSANPTLELIGDNILNAALGRAVNGPLTGASVTFDGTGTVTCTSASGPGIGGLESVTVLSGTVTAYGGDGGAGIGGSKASGQEGNGINVNVNGGRVFAYGDGGAAGIGGGENAVSGTGGNFVISAGMVRAEPGADGNGYGIGSGGNAKSPGSVTVNGGSVDASMPVTPRYNGKDLHLTVLDMEDWNAGMEYCRYSVDDADTQISSSVDEDGKLYLFLNAGWQWIRVYLNGTTYYRYMNVSATSASNSGTCFKTIHNDLISFAIPGQTSDTVYDSDSVTVTVPSNIKKNGEGLPVAVPDIRFDGADSQPRTGENLTFTATPDPLTFSAQLTVVGHDKSPHVYTVYLKLDESTVSGPTLYDISKGSITVFDTGIEYGGTEYEENPNGYVIFGTTDSNTIRISHDNPDTGTPDDIPDITLRDLNISSSGTALDVRWHADIYVEGDCSLSSSSASDAAVITRGSLLHDELKLNIYGADDNDMLRVSSSDTSAIDLGPGTAMSVTGVNAAFTAPDGIDAVTCSAPAADRERMGHFITDSEHYMLVTSSDDPAVVPTYDDGTPLCQLRLHIDTENTDIHSCTYTGEKNGVPKQYYIDDATLCLMAPNDTYIVSVMYGGDEYNGNIEELGPVTEAQLVKLSVDRVVYDSTFLDHNGGEKKRIFKIPKAALYILYDAFRHIFVRRLRRGTYGQCRL